MDVVGWLPRRRQPGRTAGPIEYPGFGRAAVQTMGNTFRYVMSRRRHLILEGRMHGGEYRNWSGDRRHDANWAQPESAEEVVAVVRSASRVRVVGAGHSFNDGLASDGVTLSLDRLAGIIDIDHSAKRATVWGGTRVRDLTRALLAEGLALRSLASHDAQSVAGVLATDVHGSGSGPAHLSDQVVSIDLVDGSGDLHVHVAPDDDRFRAAVGGIGSVGVITKVTVQCVDAFDLRRGSRVESRDWAAANLDDLSTVNEHVSFYAYPFTKLVHVHTWAPTDAGRSRLGGFRESVNEAKAAVVAATVGDATAHWGLLPRTAKFAMRMQRPTELVLHSHEAFSRSQYHLHQELEFAIPRERVWEALDQMIALYERRYREQTLPFLLVEVRFSPAGHDVSFLGAGVERDSAWLCVCCNQSGAVGDYFADIEEWVRSSDARIHLGKWCEGLDSADIAKMHETRFDRFQAVRGRLDPGGRFSNPYVDRILGPAGTT